MNNLFKKNNVYNGFLLLIFLNIFDGVATYIGLSRGFYIEKNGILNYIYQCNEMLFIAVKILIPTIVLFVLMFKLGDKVSKFIKLMFYLANTVYIFLCIYHIGLYTIVMKVAID